VAGEGIGHGGKRMKCKAAFKR